MHGGNVTKMRAFFNTLLACALLFASGCAVMSKDLRTDAERDLTFAQVFKNPELHRGKVVIWGGMIVDSRNTRDGTLLEVLQKPLDMVGEPRDVDQSGGRFIALYDGFLDVAIYTKDREVTVGGVVQGRRVMPLGEIEYAYPVISVREIYLWPEVRKERVPPYYYRGYPWWWHDPFWRPWHYHHR
jgi:outer membrane lipoprotein